MLNTEAGKTM